MPELSDQEKMERRRQKRQQRILSSAGDRLSRITGTAYPLRGSPSPSPSTSASSLARSDTPIQDSNTAPRSRSPSPAVFTRTPTTSTDQGRSSRTAQQQQPTSTSSTTTHMTYNTSDDDPSDALGAPPPLDPMDMFAAMGQQHRPTMDGPMPTDLNDIFAAAGAGGGFPFNPALLASMTGATAGGDASSTPAASTVDPSLKYWNLIHLISMLMLGLYAVYTEWITAGMTRMAQLLNADASQIYGLTHSGAFVPLFWYFATIQLCLQSARMFYQQGTITSQSTLGALATQLPPPLNNIITIFLRYRLIWSCLVQDCCVLVFVIGFAQVISAVLV